MNSYVTWAELIQTGIFLTGFASLIIYIVIYIVLHNNKK